MFYLALRFLVNKTQRQTIRLSPWQRKVAGLIQRVDSLPLLSEPLEGGYTLTYTSDIDKDMSGGGIFDDNNRLIGINAAHQEPLWEANRKYQSGKPVTAQLNQQLDLVALGLSLQQVKEAIGSVVETFKESIPPEDIDKACSDEGTRVP